MGLLEGEAQLSHSVLNAWRRGDNQVPSGTGRLRHAQSPPTATHGEYDRTQQGQARYPPASDSTDIAYSRIMLEFVGPHTHLRIHTAPTISSFGTQLPHRSHLAGVISTQRTNLGSEWSTRKDVQKRFDCRMVLQIRLR